MNARIQRCPSLPLKRMAWTQPTVVPLPEIKKQHWKVGDNMGSGQGDPEGFKIAQIAWIDLGKGKYAVAFFDSTGKQRGHVKARLAGK